jgi:metallo-beta-lactamase family protein
MSEITLTFCSGVGTATGANFLMETPEGKKILVDCGLIQGVLHAQQVNAQKFIYNPAEIDYLFVTHAHADHIGRIPRLIKEGFKGSIYSTPETKALASVMLPDILMQLTREAKEANLEPMYSTEHVEKTIQLWQEIEYHTLQTIAEFTIDFKDAGHILGSSMITFARNGKSIVFTGDLGNTPSPLLKDTEKLQNPTYMVMESVYGDRNHESKAERGEKFKQAVIECTTAGGTLLIPSFSIERTQVLLHELNHLIENNEVPQIPVFFDSPLAEKVTDVYKKYRKNFNLHIQEDFAAGDDIFNFPGLKTIRSHEDSEALSKVRGSKIIIAGSGMSVGGRILQHEINYLGDPKSTLLLVGYQAVGTLGRKLQDGATTVRISGVEVEVHARIRGIYGYSSHKDSDHLIEFVQDNQDSLKKVFVAMGEPKASLFLVQRLRDYVGVDAVYPQLGKPIVLEF